MLTKVRKRLSGRTLGILEWSVLLFAWAAVLAVGFGVSRRIHAQALGDQHWDGGTTWWLIGGCSAVVIVGVLTWWITHLPVDSPGHVDVAPFASGIPPAPSADWVSTFLMLVDPSRYSPRSVERASYSDGYYRHEVVREFQIPVIAGRQSWLRRRFGQEEAAEVDVLLPVLRLRRDFLVDNLETMTAEGARLSTLNAAEYLSVVRELLRASLAALSDDNGDDQLPDDVARCIDKMLLQGSFAHSSAQTDQTLAEERLSALRRLIEWINPEDPSLDHFDETDADDWRAVRGRIARLCEAFAHDHIVFVIARARPGDRVVIKYRFTAPHHPKRRRSLLSIMRNRFARWAGRLPDPSPMRLGLRDSVRYRVGLRPHVHQIPITAHRWSQSYHLEFEAPQETYVYDCRVDFRPSVQGAPPGSIVDYSRGGYRGADYAHFYVRETARNEYRERPTMVAVVDCREKPPGMLGSVTILAMAQALLIWVVGWHIDKFFPGASGHDAHTDLPAVLLALPGVISGLLGAQFTGERLRTSSLATLWGIVGCGVLAILSTATALAKSSGANVHPVHGIVHPVWLALMLLSFGLAADLGGRGYIRVHRYVSRINTPGDEATILI